jgi:glycosyltransferase involved in cell wall biosynthesis
MNQNIRVSICVPVYGAEKFMEKCARSLFEQTYEHIEYVFVNDCTPDRSIDIIREVMEDYPQRKASVRIVEHEHNKGLSASRHTGVLNATGDYIFHFDDDDYLELDAISQYVACAQKTGADMVMADYIWVFQDKAIRHYDTVPADKKEYVRRLLTRKSTIQIWGRLIRRQFILDNDLFAPDGLDLSEDYVLIPVMAYKAAKVAKVDAALVNYVRYNTASGSTVVRRRGLETTVRALELLDDFFSGIPDAADYADAIQVAKLHNKVTLYGLAAKADYDFVRPLYPEVSVWRSPLELKKKLLLTLASWGLDSLVFKCIHQIIK